MTFSEPLVYSWTRSVFLPSGCSLLSGKGLLLTGRLSECAHPPSTLGEEVYLMHISCHLNKSTFHITEFSICTFLCFCIISVLNQFWWCMCSVLCYWLQSWFIGTSHCYIGGSTLAGQKSDLCDIIKWLKLLWLALEQSESNCLAAGPVTCLQIKPAELATDVWGDSGVCVFSWQLAALFR